MMSGTLTVIIGLCGSGKSWLLNKLHQAHPGSMAFDEQMSDHGKPGIKRRKEIAKALKAGNDCFVADLFVGKAAKRRTVVRHLRKLVKGLRIVWMFYEVNLKRCNDNCGLRKKGDPKGHRRINRKWAPLLEAPKQAIMLKTFKLTKEK